MDARSAHDAETWQVVVGGAVVGGLSLARRGDDLVVLEPALDDVRHVGVLRALLECHALAVGGVGVTIEVAVGGPPVATTLVDEGFDVASVRLRLALGPDLPGEERVALRPMGREGFEVFSSALAEDGVRERTAQLADLLPDGLDSPDQQLFTGWAGDTVVGHLWLSTRRPTAFVHHVDVVPEQRRRGYGAGLMRAGAHWAREHGSVALGLDVLGHDTAARALHAGLGYETVDETHRMRLRGVRGVGGQ